MNIIYPLKIPWHGVLEAHSGALHAHLEPCISPWSLLSHHEDMEAHPEAMLAHSEAVEAKSGAIEAHPGALHAHPRGSPWSPHCKKS
jgi:hypothetical protein